MAAPHTESYILAGIIDVTIEPLGHLGWELDWHCPNFFDGLQLSRSDTAFVLRAIPEFDGAVAVVTDITGNVAKAHAFGATAIVMVTADTAIMFVCHGV